MKAGEVYIAPSGLTFKIKKVLKDSVTVEVRRRYLNKESGEVTVRINERVVPMDLFETFARAYEKKP